MQLGLILMCIFTADYHDFGWGSSRKVPGKDQLDEYGDGAQETSGFVAD
jgi:hypothetical protein